eukprot:1037223-Rhodomonas_salina.1
MQGGREARRHGEGAETEKKRGRVGFWTYAVNSHGASALRAQDVLLPLDDAVFHVLLTASAQPRHRTAEEPRASVGQWGAAIVLIVMKVTRCLYTMTARTRMGGRYL